MWAEQWAHGDWGSLLWAQHLPALLCAASFVRSSQYPSPQPAKHYQTENEEGIN
jgi:hypothetical protein